MKTTSTIIFLVAALLTTSCAFVSISGSGKAGKNDGNGIVAEKSFDICDFAGIKLDVPASVSYKVAEAPSMSVRLDENLMDYLKVSVTDGLLKIGSTRPLRNFKVFNIALSSSALLELDCNGAADFASCDPIYADIFEMKTSGTAHVEIDSLVARVTRMSVNGAGEANVYFVDGDNKYAFKQADVKLNGSGNVTLSSSSKIRVVSVDIKGTGTVDLTGLDYEYVDKRHIGRGSVNTGNRPDDIPDPSDSENN